MRRLLYLACLLLLLLPSLLWAADKTPEELEKDVSRLRDWLRGPSAERWQRAAKEAKDIAPASKPLLPELCLLTLNGSKPTRQAAIEAVEAIDKPLYEAILYAITNHTAIIHPRSRNATSDRQAIQRLMRLQTEAAPAAEFLIKLGEIEAATIVASDNPQVVETVFRLASNRATRRQGLEIMHNIEIDEKHQVKAVDCLISGLKEGHIIIASNRLKELGSVAKKAIPALRDAKGARREEERDAASSALDAIEQAISDEKSK